jgi:hypothetical protein
MPTRWSGSIRSTALLAACAVASCGVFKKPDQETQAIVDRRVVGISMGDFIDSFGRPNNRSEQLDGTTAYYWVSKLASVPNGFAPLDNAVCTLSIIADARGRIVSAQVVLDDPGNTSASQCEALFKTK